MTEMMTLSSVGLLPRDRASVLQRRKMKRNLQSRRHWLTINLGYTTKATRLWAVIAELRVLNSRLDALGARSRPVRGLAVAGEVT